MSKKNQTSFKPGQSGNPSGRPKREWTWASLLEQVGEEIEPKSKQKFKDLVSKKLWIKAVNGDVMAIKEILNRMDGMPPQRNIHEGDEDNPIPIDIRSVITKIYGNTNTKTDKDST